MLTTPELMTLAEYAAHRGVSASYIRRMRRRGSLVLGDGGLVEVRASDDLLDGLTHPIHGGPRAGSGRPAGGRADGRTGAAAGESAAEPAVTLPHARDSSAGPAALPRAGSEPAPAATATADSTGGGRRSPAQVRDRRPPASRESAAGASPPPLPTSITVQEAVRRERLARARLAELELGEQSGQLMRVDAVNRAVFTLVRQALNQLQGMSARLAKTLAAESDAFRVGALLDAEVANVCQEMQAAAASLLELGGAASAAESPDADVDPDPDTDDVDTEAAGQ